ncbi:EamA family transporter [Poseidonibacter parvus]|uniref:EamA family transporter n=1 Tax=Poseidonibacter parvus TaxID=1850254 RepID=A0A1P8KIW3_9BACT|nr:DMT family transporter [Poseidonibacter parvus]APW64489.1 EamA family transporter [Poseidonibacter parvus]
MSNNAKGLALTSLGVLIMSLESLFVKLTNIDALTFCFYLGIFIFISMTSFLIIKQKDIINKITSTSFPMLIICATLMGSSNVFFISGLKNTSVANVVLIFGTAALFSSLFAFLIYKERITKNIILASIFMIIGLVVIFVDELSLGGMKGNLFALLSVCTFSLAFVFLVRYKNISRVVLTACLGISMSIISLIFSDTLNIDLRTLGIIAIMGLFITPVARVLMGNGTKYINASEVTLLMIIETVMAPVWVWLFLNEIPSSNTFIGGFIIVFTLIINSLYTLRKGNIK